MDLTGAELRILLQICVDREHECYRNAWLEFERRYRKVILGRIYSITKNREDTQDIAQTVMLRLIDNDFRVLNIFYSKHSEIAFIAWLNVICTYTSFSHLSKRRATEELDEDQKSSIDAAKTRSEIEKQGQWVSALRNALSATKKSSFASERDIFIFLLRKLYEFESKEVAEILALDVTPGNVDNIVNRLSNLLRKNKNQLRDF